MILSVFGATTLSLDWAIFQEIHMQKPTTLIEASIFD